MEYTTIYLTIDRDEAARVISRKVDGVRRERRDGYYVYRDLFGHHLAELSEAELPDGTEGAALRYRTAISAVAYTVRQKSTRIRDVLARYEYERR